MSYPPQQQPGGWQDPSWPSPQSPPPQSPQPAPYDPYAQPVSGGQAGAPYGGYAAYPGYGQPAPATPATNGLAIASLVCSIAGVATCISAPIGAILGHIAKRQIRERGEGGEGMATAGIIIGWILTALGIIGCGIYVAVVVWAIGQDPSAFDGT